MIGATIKRLREEKGWTQEELAAKMGYTSKSTINKIEKNINDVSQRNIIKFSQVFGCDVTELLFGEPATDDEKPVENALQKYDPQMIERAIRFLEAYERANPEIQNAIQSLLKVRQRDP